MSDDELIEKARGALGCLYAHRMMGSADAIAGLCERYAAARAEAERLRDRPELAGVMELIRGCLDVAGVAEIVIDERSARAILAEHEIATAGRTDVVEFDPIATS